jgi:hypothetical protein
MNKYINSYENYKESKIKQYIQDNVNTLLNIYTLNTFDCPVVYYNKHITVNETPYKITVNYGSKTEVFSGKIKIEDESIPICSFTLGDEQKTNNPLIDKSKESLLRERVKLQRQLNQIDNELENFRHNNNLKKQ